MSLTRSSAGQSGSSCPCSRVGSGSRRRACCSRATALCSAASNPKRSHSLSRMLRGLVRDPDFLKLWVGETISDFGDQMTLLAIPLTAVIVLKASAFEIGLLSAVGTLATPPLSPPPRGLVGRLPRPRTLLVCDASEVLGPNAVSDCVLASVHGHPHPL